MPKWPVRVRVEVEWRDSMSRGGWDSVKKHRKRRKVGPCRSIGYLLRRDRHVVQLAQSLDRLNGNAADTITIPRENVKRIRRVRVRRR